jgi:cation diffusion facilitator family transporter
MSVDKIAQRTAIYSILLNILLFGSKLWVGLFSQSIALIADAWHTLSDSLSSLVVFIGLKACSKPPDKNHPFGHGRLDFIASIIVAMMLFIVGYHFLLNSIARIHRQEAANYGIWALIITAISILVKEGMARYSIYIGKKNNVSSLIADGWHHRSDSFSSVVILIGIFLGRKFWWIDGALGITLALLLFIVALGILKKNVNTLLGNDIDSQLESEIGAVIHSLYPDRSLHLHHIHLHNYGRHKEITFHIQLPSDLTLDRAHHIAHTIEMELQKKLNLFATIHTEPLYE